MKKHLGLIISFGFLLLAIGLFAAKALSPSTLDAQGMLHEPFYLLPLGYASLLAALGGFAAVGIAKLRHR